MPSRLDTDALRIVMQSNDKAKFVTRFHGQTANSLHSLFQAASIFDAYNYS